MAGDTRSLADAAVPEGQAAFEERFRSGWMIAEYEAMARERDRLLARLPDGMKGCKIILKQCEHGHHWLTAANWIDRGCFVCECNRLRSELSAARQKFNKLLAAIQDAMDEDTSEKGATNG